MTTRPLPRFDVAEAEAVGAVLAAYEAATYQCEMVAEYGDGDESPEWQTAQAHVVRLEQAYRALDPFEADAVLMAVARSASARALGA